MILQIKGQEIKLFYTFRAFMIYENITGKSFQIGTSLTEMMYLFFSIIQGSIMKNRITMEFSWDDFQDYLDDNPKAVSDFSEWLIEIMNNQNFMSEKNPGDKKSSGNKKKLPKE